MCWTKILRYGLVTVKPQYIPFFGLNPANSGSIEQIGENSHGLITFLCEVWLVLDYVALLVFIGNSGTLLYDAPGADHKTLP